MKKQLSKLGFYNKIIDKSELKRLIVWAFRNYGIARAANMSDKLKDLGFYYATKAGISLSLEDLRIPPTKTNLLNNTISSIEYTDSRYKRGEITTVERFQQVIDTWNNASEQLKQEVIEYFKCTDPLNSIYMMAFSGARANISQVRQLVGMRGLMSDPQGKIIDLPISSNFREGLTVTDYFISSYGARKGLVDTALRTADSGYLTRRLVDVAQDIIIRESDCQTVKGILIESMANNQKTLISLHQSLVGRVLAEDIFHPISHNLVASCGQAVSPELADQIVSLGLKSALVRSPMTCNSIRSVCQLCYGWNLAHGRMVDLGEAVGIIAAQSIGEPGTQLTMRTFHTGGVFTGELNQSIISPINGIIEYPSNIKLSLTRTRYGDQAVLVNKDCYLKIFNKSEVKLINLVKGSLLLLKDKSKVINQQVIGEYPLSSNTITEKAQKVVLTDFSGSIHLTKFRIDLSNHHISVSKKTELASVIWVLSGKVCNIPDNVSLLIKHKQKIYENSLLAKTQIISRYSGRVSILKKGRNDTNQYIQIFTSSKTFKNIKVYSDIYDGYKNHLLEIENSDRFLLTIEPKEKIVHGQIIGNLISNVYKTNTGGIIKYLDLNINQKQSENNKDYYDILGTGYILWIAEETHEISKDLSLLLVQPGQFVEAGTEIIKNIFANNAGILEVIHKDGIIRELVIKPGFIQNINTSNIKIFLKKRRGFLKPGETIIDNISTDKLVYWEYMQVNNQNFILIRPVIIYSIPDRKLNLNYSKDSFAVDIFNLKLIRRTYFRDGERVKSVTGINLIKVYLVADLKSGYENLYCCMNFIPQSMGKNFNLLRFMTVDTLSVRDINMRANQDYAIYSTTKILVSNNQIIEKDSVVAQTEFFSSIQGCIEVIQKNQSSNIRILVVGESDLKKFKVKNEKSIKVKISDWVYAGDEIALGVISHHSGKIISITNDEITMRIGQPYLISKGSFIHVMDGNLVKRGENIATLIFKRVKTGDIVQGLPRIEEILEARKKSDNYFNPHSILETKFREYLNRGLSIYDSTRLSFLEVQLYLIQEVQLVYQSQDVDIADKHIEVIVRQMTSKVKIEKGGDTDYLPGEIIELQKIDSINKSLALLNKMQASYHPILLGITKASLNTASFISAASFQETTKVLTEAAISGKLDWLRGLKENVIIGRLIPAGTGFNIYNNNLDTESQIISQTQPVNKISHMSKISISTNSEFEDIILDDRVARNYPLNADSN